MVLPWILRARGVPQAIPEGTVVSGIVATVNLVDKTCTLTDGTVVRLAGRTADVAAALTGGVRLRIDAEGIPSVDGLMATEVWIRPE